MKRKSERERERYRKTDRQNKLNTNLGLIKD